jgi:hypothetical protein
MLKEFSIRKINLLLVYLIFFSRIKIVSVASSIASSVSMVVPGVVVTTSVASVVPVGLELFLFDLFFLVGNFTDFLVLKSEESFVTHTLDVNSFGTEVTVTSSVTSSVSSVFEREKVSEVADKEE